MPAREDRVSGALARLRPLVSYDAALADVLAMLESAEAQTREAAHALREHAGLVFQKQLEG